ncbi:putative exported protein [Vibrio ishigakensis]|uniref:Putative exported protein n=1 Tax=Vibrio ishigakensis TaxID=1481914 RepID=A0A0B8PDX1_9VIBR|nr:putative exported protein [Vibrio ishigakensis]
MKKLLSLISATSILVAGLIPLSAHAKDEWPSKNITLVVPFAAGGSTDILSRRVAELLQKEVGKPVVVENRPGAGSTIATGQLARERRDVDYRIIMLHRVTPLTHLFINHCLTIQLIASAS